MNAAERAIEKMVRDTNTRIERGKKQKIDGSSSYALWAYPAWSLERIYSAPDPQTDWISRWKAAGDSVGWKYALPGDGVRMVARKDSPIWAALGAGVGGFSDSTGTDVPPFAVGSGLGWVAIKRAEAEALGMLTDGGPKNDSEQNKESQKEWNALFTAIGQDGIEKLIRDLDADVETISSVKSIIRK